MDDLFRKAAEGYQLKEGDSHWERIAAGMQSNRRFGRSGEFRPRKNYTLLLMLFPIAFVFHNSFKERVNTHTGIDVIVSRDTALEGNIRDQNNHVIVDFPIARRSFSRGARNIKRKSEKDQSLMPPSLPRSEKYFYQPGTIVPPSIDEKQEAVADTRKKNVNKNKGFYFGPVAGLDFASVKGQAFTEVGNNIGVLIGYRFTKRISFESGISWVQRKYFTSGEEFSMKKLQGSMPAGMAMEAVNGHLSLFEIPYKIKFDLMPGQKHHVFVTAGGSTNIYVKESNTYLTLLNGVQEIHKATYSNIHCSPLCMIHISAGYERRIGKQSWFRLEPYVKVPLQKVGMGSVPIFSAGLNVAIYRSGYNDR